MKDVVGTTNRDFLCRSFWFNAVVYYREALKIIVNNLKVSNVACPLSSIKFLSLFVVFIWPSSKRSMIRLKNFRPWLSRQ